MKIIKQPVLLGLLLLLLFAASIPIIAYLFRDTRIPAEADLLIRLERTPCFGTCPVYQVEVHGNGEVIYRGEAFVQTTGEQLYVIDPAEMAELRHAFERIDFFSLKDEYTDMSATDMPSAITTLVVDGHQKTIVHYYGDFEAPKALTDLETEIDRITNTARWIETAGQ